MTWWQNLLTGGVGAGVIAGGFMLLQWHLNRKAQKEDRQQDRKLADCQARGREIDDLRKKVEISLLVDRMILYDRIKHLAKSYIARGYITIEEHEDLLAMHELYHDKDKLNGNGFLDGLMRDCGNLPKRVGG